MRTHSASEARGEPATVRPKPPGRPRRAAVYALPRLGLQPRQGLLVDRQVGDGAEVVCRGRTGSATGLKGAARYSRSGSKDTSSANSKIGPPTISDTALQNRAVTLDCVVEA